MIVVFLLSCEAIKVDAKTKKGATPLHWAAQNNYDNVAKLLLQKGANVNPKDNQGTTPLHWAAGKGHKDVVELLLNKGADVNHKDNQGTTPLHWAVEQDDKDVVELLLNKSADVNRKDVVELLLNKSADVNCGDNKGCTPLILAAQNGYADVAGLLLEKGAEVNLRDKKDRTPLHWAAQNDYDNVAKLLLQKGANVNAKDNQGTTPLDWAAKGVTKVVVSTLLADPNTNVGSVKVESIKKFKKADKEKFSQKKDRDCKLFEKVKEAKGVDENKVDELLGEIKKLLKSKNECGFKPSLNYSPDGDDENTTIKIAIEAGGKLLQCLCDYVEENMVSAEIFERLKNAKEKQESSQPRSVLNDVSTPHNLAQARASIR